MKRLISILLCCLFTFGLIGCNSNKKEVEKTPVETKEVKATTNTSDDKIKDTTDTKDTNENK